MEESKATQVINAYLNFCEALRREGEITHKNFNRIRIINGCIGGQQESIRAVWGNLFDEIYCLLEKPEIKSRLEKEKKEVQLLREKRKRHAEKGFSNSQPINAGQRKPSESLSRIEQKAKKFKKSKTKQNLPSSKSKKNKKQKQPKQLRENKTNKNFKNNSKSIDQDEFRRIYWESVARAEKEQKRRESQNKSRKKILPSRKDYSSQIFYEESIFEDIMDERRAEGKGYGGAK